LFPQKNIQKNISTTNHLIEKCLGCNSDDVHYRLIKRKKKSAKSRTIKKYTKYDYHPDEVPIKKKLNPAKAYNLLRTSAAGAIKNPILSLPKLEREDIGANIRSAIEIQRKHIRSQCLPFEISSLIFEKYPQVREIMEHNYDLIAKGCKVLDEITESVTDDQWDRSLLDWVPICNTALKEGYHVASSKYYAITPEGKKKRLSPKYIKKKIPQIQEFVFRYNKYVPFYDLFVYYMLAFAENDQEIFKELKKIELRHMREFIPDLFQMFRSKLLEVQGDTNGTFNNQNVNKDTNYYDYEYIEFRHFDKNKYEEQKLKIKQGERKANPDGWKTCCTIKAEDLPLETLEHLRETTK
jgi:hypothetical protein